MPLDQRQTFLRWAGGKRRLINYLQSYLPDDVSDRTYREPFLGAGSLFLEVGPKSAVLSDLNEDLIETFRQVRARPDLIFRYLQRHASLDCEEHYYRVRDAYNGATMYSAAQAARFIYLNRTCFNGIFRVNKSNEFNVPYGKLTKPLFPSAAHLEWIAAALECAKLQSLDYVDALSDAAAGDFVYLDPPYPPLNGTSFFRHYTPERFGKADQATVAAWVKRLSARGCLIMVSNADTPDIRELYAGFEISTVPVTRYVSAKNVKHAVRELVITNYPV
ncbi:MAG TPA: Dam family site-specific DNA-(adenine-N6)-methyltransferase [Candidatus Krumholzibacteria bacterium]|nr:Dam family site-specific DNA-(adenine-N6)-methyltransferase [Candidatus Krumholzibacteria bacterium]